MNWTPGDRVFTPFSQAGTVVAPKGDPVPYHTLVMLDDEDRCERVNPRWFLSDALERAPEIVSQMSLLG